MNPCELSNRKNTNAVIKLVHEYGSFSIPNADNNTKTTIYVKDKPNCVKNPL
jgi:hypothetical protein